MPFYLLSGGSMVALQFESVLAAAGLLWGVHRLARRDTALPAWAPAAAVWMVGLYPAFQLYAQRVLSDMTYVMLVVFALGVLPTGSRTEPEDADRVDRRWLAGCVLALAAFYVRTAGITLLAAIVGWALWRRHWKRAAVAALGFAAAAAPWVLWTRLAPSGAGGYVGTLVTSGNPFRGPRGPVGELVERLGKIFVEYATFQLPHLFWPVDPAPLAVRSVGLAAGGALLVYGAWRLLRARGVAPSDLYVLATLALLPFWPWIGDRFFLTVAPFLWMYLLAGLAAAGRRARVLPTAALGAVGLVLLVGAGVEASRQWDRTRAWMRGDVFGGYTAFWADYFQAARWIGENTPAGAVVLARKPTLAWYWSGRAAVAPSRSRNPEVQWNRLRQAGVTHILLEPWTEEAMGDAIHPRRDKLAVVYQTPRREVVVLSVRPEAAP